MSRYFIFIISVLFFNTIQAQGIEFEHGNWEEALEKAKKADKLLFVDSYTTWCGPCKKLSKNVFPNEKVGAFFNENFISLKLDMEKENGMRFGMKYRVTAYPTMFFISGDGKVVYKIKGYRQPDALIQEGKIALSSYDRSGEMAEAYASGERDVEFMIKYVNELNKTNKESLKIANDYVKNHPDLPQKDLARFLFAAATESDSKLFELMLDYDDFLINTYGQDIWNQKILSACSKTVDTAIEYEYKDLIGDATKQVKKNIGKKEAKKFECEACIEYYKSTGNKEEYLSFMKDYINKIAKKDVQGLTWAIKDLLVTFGGSEEQEKLALTAASKAYKSDTSQETGLMYARLLHNSGDNEKALDVLNEVRDILLEEKKSPRAIDNIIKKIKAS